MDKNQRVIITGANGLLGLALVKLAPKNSIIIPTFHKNTILEKLLGHTYIPLDITDKKSVKKLFDKERPTAIIHTASLGNVDQCEKNPDLAEAINVEGTNNILVACENFNTKLIFTSTNAVFDGKNPPYNEKSKVNPLNIYGKTKVKAEEIIRSSKAKYIIARLTLMYGWNHPNERQNPVTWLLDKLKNNEKIKMVNDTYTNPVFNEDAAAMLWKLLLANKKGLYHIAGKERVNRYLFAKRTAKIFGHDASLIEPVTSDYFAGIAPRMPDTTYDLTKIIAELSVRPLSIRRGLSKMKKHNYLYE